MNEEIKKINDPFEKLNELSKLGKKEKDVLIGEVTVTVGTIDADDETNVFISCAKYDGTSYFYKLKQETLKYAIKAVDTIRIDDYKRIIKDEDREAAKKQALERIEKIIKTWDDGLINYLYTEQAQLAKDSEKDLEKLGIKVSQSEDSKSKE